MLFQSFKRNTSFTKQFDFLVENDRSIAWIGLSCANSSLLEMTHLCTSVEGCSEV